MATMKKDRSDYRHTDLWENHISEESVFRRTIFCRLLKNHSLLNKETATSKVFIYNHKVIVFFSFYPELKLKT